MVGPTSIETVGKIYSMCLLTIRYIGKINIISSKDSTLFLVVVGSDKSRLFSLCVHRRRIERAANTAALLTDLT